MRAMSTHRRVSPMASQMTTMPRGINWSREFEDLIPLPKGKPLVTFAKPRITSQNYRRPIK
jgi:hypothetical protein